MGKTFKVRKIVRGTAKAEAIVCPGGFSFLGDVDMDTGEIIAAGNSNKGQNIAGKILIFGESKGSSGGCVVLMTLFKNHRAPSAIISLKPADYNLTEGAILCGIPFVCEPDSHIFSKAKTGDIVSVNSDEEFVEITD